MGAQRLDFNNFWRPFGYSFFIKFRNHPNLLDCNKHGAKTLRLPFQAFHFGIANPYFFCDTLLDPIFPHFNLMYDEKCDLWTPFKIQWGAKRHPKRHPKSFKWRPKALKKHRTHSRFRVLGTDSLPKGRPKRRRVHIV